LGVGAPPVGKGFVVNPFVRLAQDAMQGREMQTALLLGPRTRKGRILGRERT